MLLTRARDEELQLIGGGWRARFLELLTRTLLATGRRAGAERIAVTAKACADAVAPPNAAAIASLAVAALALELVAALFDTARTLELAGRVRSAGDRDRAALELELESGDTIVV